MHPKELYAKLDAVFDDKGVEQDRRSGLVSNEDLASIMSFRSVLSIHVRCVLGYVNVDRRQALAKLNDSYRLSKIIRTEKEHKTDVKIEVEIYKIEPSRNRQAARWGVFIGQTIYEKTSWSGRTETYAFD